MVPGEKGPELWTAVSGLLLVSLVALKMLLLISHLVTCSTRIVVGRQTNAHIPAADPEISKRGGTDRLLYTPLTAHARTKRSATRQKKGGARAPCALC